MPVTCARRMPAPSSPSRSRNDPCWRRSAKPAIRGAPHGGARTPCAMGSGPSSIPVSKSQPTSSCAAPSSDARGSASEGTGMRYAVILAGGKGTRLRPFTVTLPKPLVPIGDTPIIEISIRRLAQARFDVATLAINHMGDLIRAYFGDGEKFGVALRYSLEPEPLGTFGPLRLLHDLPDHFLVMNADVLTDLDLGAFLDRHTASGAAFTIAATRRDQVLDFGVLGVEGERLVSSPTRRKSISSRRPDLRPGLLERARGVLSRQRAGHRRPARILPNGGHPAGLRQRLLLRRGRPAADPGNGAVAAEQSLRLLESRGRSRLQVLFGEVPCPGDHSAPVQRLRPRAAAAIPDSAAHCAGARSRRAGAHRPRPASAAGFRPRRRPRLRLVHGAGRGRGTRLQRRLRPLACRR